jgi:hypothetical protein
MRQGPGSGSASRSDVRLAFGLWPLASFGRIYSRALLAMLHAVPTVLVVEDLVPSRASLELHDEDRFHARAFAGR